MLDVSRSQEGLYKASEVWSLSWQLLFQDFGFRIAVLRGLGLETSLASRD